MLCTCIHPLPRVHSFSYVSCGGGGPAGITVGVVGSPGQALTLTSVDPHGTVHVATVTVPQAGTAVAQL